MTPAGTQKAGPDVGAFSGMPASKDTHWSGGSRKALDQISGELLDGERPLAALACQSLDSKGKRKTIGALVLTDQRVLYRGMLLFEKEAHTFALGDVNAVSLQKGMLLAGVSVSVAGATIAVDSAGKDDSAAFVAAAQAALANRRTAMSSVPTASIADELAKLAALRDGGVLTEEEFQAQKTKLLR